MDGVEYDYVGDTPLNETSSSTKTKVCLFVLIICIILLAAMSVFFLIKINNSKDKGKNNTNNNSKDKEDIIEKKIYLDSYGIKLVNVSYSKDGIIPNSFKKTGENYKEELGNINEGKDYQKSEYNYYNLYIPFSDEKRKKEYNQIFLFIHGGAWSYGKKERMDFLCKTYSDLGYITATLGYTLLYPIDNSNNVFRMIDDISAAIKNIKERLKNEGYNEDQLELAIGGASAGAHLSLLYAYSIKKPAIPIKFVINISGPTSLEPKYLIKLKEGEYLDSIEPFYINEAKLQNKTETLDLKTQMYFVSLINLLLGNKYSEDQLKQIFNNTYLDEENEIYKKMIALINIAIPINYVDENSIPTLCIYGEKDTVVGIEQYALLKKKFDNKNNTKIGIIYSRNWGHSIGEILEQYEGISETREIHYQILNYSRSYFTSNPNIIFI